MNRLVNLRVLLAIAAAVVFFLIACSNNDDSPETGGQVDSSSSVPSSSSAEVFAPPTPESFTETGVNGVPFDMIYIPGGTFTLGCEKSSGCPADTKPVEGTTVSGYFIGKTEVTTALWNAVMGTTCSGYTCYGASSASYTSMDWYDAHEFACKLSELTNKNYRMLTEAEWEYAAKNYKDNLEKINSTEEWAYNSWQSTHTGGVDPIGPMPTMSTKGPILHTQKTRRDASGTADNITGRLIRSIDGIGPALRLAISAETDFPPSMLHTCNIHPPKLEGPEPANSYRDMRWVTGSDSKWSPPVDAIMSGFDLRVWEDGTARLGTGYGSYMNYTNGQWFTSNNITFVFVPNSGSNIVRFAYIFLDEVQGSLIPNGSSSYIGRIVKELADNYAKPDVSVKTGEALAKEQANFETDYKMIDMANIPSSAKKQDERLLDGPNQGWFQDNRSAGGVHHYRKDVDPDEFRFTVNELGRNSQTILTNGTWFTVNNTFLRVTHKDGYTTDYLYSITGNNDDPSFYHNSFQAYERADFRIFKKTPNNGDVFNATCRDLCNDEIPKDKAASFYASQAKGQSTFVPAPCPSGGCR